MIRRDQTMRLIQAMPPGQDRLAMKRTLLAIRAQVPARRLPTGARVWGEAR